MDSARPYVRVDSAHPCPLGRCTAIENLATYQMLIIMNWAMKFPLVCQWEIEKMVWDKGHYLVTPYIERKGLARISREVVFTFLGNVIGKILQDLKYENISEILTLKPKNNSI